MPSGKAGVSAKARAGPPHPESTKLNSVRKVLYGKSKKFFENFFFYSKRISHCFWRENFNSMKNSELIFERWIEFLAGGLRLAQNHFLQIFEGWKITFESQHELVSLGAKVNVERLRHNVVELYGPLSPECSNTGRMKPWARLLTWFVWSDVLWWNGWHSGLWIQRSEFKFR